MKKHKFAVLFKRHPYLVMEDIIAILMATVMISLGVLFFKSAGMLSGGVTGLALLSHKLTGLSFGQCFIWLNVPFFILAYFKLSKSMAIKSLICSILISFISDHLPNYLQIQYIAPYYAAIAGGFLFGMGLLSLLRHQTSLGGFTILAIILQKKYHINVGRTQLFIDATILLASLFLTSWSVLVLSLIGIFTLNLVITLFHKKRHYRGAV